MSAILIEIIKSLGMSAGYDLTKSLVLKKLPKSVTSFFSSDSNTDLFIKKLSETNGRVEDIYLTVAKIYRNIEYDRLFQSELLYKILSEVKTADLKQIGSDHGNYALDGDTIKVGRQLMRANQILSDEDITTVDSACKIYRTVINEYDPLNHQAWWGIYKCELTFANYYRYEHGQNKTEFAYVLNKILSKYALKAITYAPENMSQYYKESASNVIEYIKPLII